MGEIKKVRKKQRKKARTDIEKQLLIFLMNILQEHLKLDIKQKKEQGNS